MGRNYLHSIVDFCFFFVLEGMKTSKSVNQTTPKRAALLFKTRPRAAKTLIARQLIRNDVNLKNAARDMDRSSNIVLEDAKMPLSTAGVTGIRLEDPEEDGWSLKFEGVTVWVDDDVEGLISMTPRRR